jgi:hypothetical protein
MFDMTRHREPNGTHLGIKGMIARCGYPMQNRFVFAISSSVHIKTSPAHDTKSTMGNTGT